MSSNLIARELIMKLQQYKRSVTASAVLSMLWVLTGCATHNTAGGTASTKTINQTMSTEGSSTTRFFSGPPSKSWLQGTITKSNSILRIGTILHISGQLTRVQRNPNIQVALYQSTGADDQNHATKLAQKNLPVTGSANFKGTLTVPTFRKLSGGYFTLVFKYQGVLQTVAVLLQK